MAPVSFDWNEGNKEKNWIKHRVTIKETEQVFFNNPRIIWKDDKHSTLEERYIILGKTGSFDILPGAEPLYRLIKVQPSSSAPLCEIVYDLVATKDNQPYDTNFFIVKITG